MPTPPTPLTPLSPAAPHLYSPSPFNSSSSLWLAPALTPCDRQFGHHFAPTPPLCSPSASPSTLTCHHNPTTQSTHCTATHLHLDPSLLRCSTGAEDIGAVRWRTEEEEFPTYLPGALTVDCPRPADPPALSWPVYRDHLARAFGSLKYGPLPAAGGGECEVVEEALLVTRYEYANLYHTLTDWYNVYQALNMYMPQPTATPLLLFLDGHSKGSMDEGWPTLFTPDVRYVKQLTSPLCIRHAVFVSPGYGSPLSPSQFTGESARCARHPLVVDFARFVQRRFRLGQEEGGEVVVVKDVAGDDVVIGDQGGGGGGGGTPLVAFVVRRSYLSHPRVRLDATERTMANEADTFRAVQRALAPAVAFHAFDFTQLPLHTQLNVLYHSAALVGLHGAALSHILYMRDEAALMELMPAGYSARQHFRYFAIWSGHRYHYVSVDRGGVGGYQVDAEVIVSGVRELMKGMQGGGEGEGGEGGEGAWGGEGGGDEAEEQKGEADGKERGKGRIKLGKIQKPS